MLYVGGNLWHYRSITTPVCVTTNGIIKKNGELVMGKGIALQAKERFPELPGLLGAAVHDMGNQAFYVPKYHVLSFPTKHDWRNPSDIDLIRTSAQQIVNFADNYKFQHVYLTPPGCGNGGLHWSQVEPVLLSVFDDRFVIVIQ